MSEELTATLPGGGVLFTDRSDGNLSSVGGLNAEHGAEARNRLRERLGLKALARGYQAHGSVIQVVVRMPGSEPETGDLMRADGQATALSGLGTMVLAADCLPVAISRAGAVTMVHAGWRGLAAGVLENGTKALGDLGGSRVEGLGDLGRSHEEALGDLEGSRQEREEALVAVLGPCAGPCCYEVGPEVHAALGSDLREKAPIDLRAIARQKLSAAGVDEVVEIGGCTICEERYFSHRREGDIAGRQAGVAWLS